MGPYINNKINNVCKKSHGKNQRFINVTQLHKTLEINLSAALPAFHAFTGAITTRHFFKKGKKRPFSIMTESEDFIECFIELSQPFEKRLDFFDKIQAFVWNVYGLKRLKFINEASIALFQKTYKFLDNDNSFRLPKKGIDGSSLPPCKTELYNHFLRTCYISEIWSHAHLKVPTVNEPSDYGWVEIDNRYEFMWLSGTQLPTSIDQITQSEEDDDNEDMVENSSDSESEREKKEMSRTENEND